MSASSKNPKALSPAQRQALQQWKPTFWIPLLIHQSVEFQIKHAFRNGTCVVIYGRRGVGKTETVLKVLETIEAAEYRKAMKNQAYQPKGIERYESSTATGKKTALCDLMQFLTLSPLNYVTSHQSARTLIRDIGMELQRRNTRLIVIDEAQKIDRSNLAHLLQIPDMAQAEWQHDVGIVFVGNPTIRQKLAGIKQLGQRVPTEVHFKPAQRSTIAPHLPALHPHLAALHGKLGSREWKAVEKEVLDKTQGSPRRLMHILRLANSLALELDQVIDGQLLHNAMLDLADQI